ncbi:MAG TPA: hypothetical protein PK364_12125, partial [Synergistaceae bacterium]|nr:hypothetical protein [Synergistaceae bacterium]
MRKKTHFLVRRAFLALAFLVALPFPLRGAENPFEALQNQAFLLIQEKASEGEDLFWRGAYREALQRARELPLYATGSSSALSLARGFQSLLEAQVASRRGFDEEGLRKASEARSFFEKISHVSGELLALEVLLRSVHALDLEEERRRFEEELQGRREFREDPYGAALALLHRGIRAFEARNCSEARRYWKECAEISENLKNPEMYGLAIKHAARCAWLEGRVENSLEEYAEALDFARRSASSWLECMVSLEYAEVLVRQKGDYLRGEELLLAALEKAERLELGAPLLWICNNLGALYLEAGSFSRGEAILEKARKIQRRPGIPRDLGLLVNLGSAAMGVGDFEESEHWWLQARDLALRQKAE